MHFTFTVDVEIERTEGKFASKDEMAELIMDEISGADPQNLTGENGGEYEVTMWEVSETIDLKAKK